MNLRFDTFLMTNDWKLKTQILNGTPDIVMREPDDVMVIAFYLLDKTDNNVKKVYFSKWQGNIPIFVSDKTKAKQYWRKDLAELDVNLLSKATSKESVTLNIKLEVAEAKRNKEWLLEKIENYIPLHDKTVGDVINGILEIAKKLDEPEMKNEEKCYWILSTVLDCVIWHSDCGLDWQFSNPETPVENEMTYCPKCGKKLEVAE